MFINLKRIKFNLNLLSVIMLTNYIRYKHTYDY